MLFVASHWAKEKGKYDGFFISKSKKNSAWFAIKKERKILMMMLIIIFNSFKIRIHLFSEWRKLKMTFYCHFSWSKIDDETLYQHFFFAFWQLNWPIQLDTSFMCHRRTEKQRKGILNSSLKIRKKVRQIKMAKED